MSRLRANLITNQTADGPPTVSNGLIISGVTTTSEIFVGSTIKLDPVSGIVTSRAVDIDDFLDVGNNIKLGNAGVITATSFNGSLAASNLTGALPALDGSNLTGIVGGKFNGPAAGILTTSTVGIQTANVTSADLVGAATSMVGLYIGDGHLLFSNYLNKSGGYYITTGLNALNAGPVTLGTPMTLDGTWTIV
tara:strand:- start:2169 stop:2747 length:579 start_codon:yes stop_codon:yes gene_type:complete